MIYNTFGDTIVLRLDPGEEIFACLKQLSKQENIALGAVQGIGAARHADADRGAVLLPGRHVDQRPDQSAVRL